MQTLWMFYRVERERLELLRLRRYGRNVAVTAGGFGHLSWCD